MDSLIARLIAEIEILEMKWAALEDRVAVMEEITTDHESRLEDLEEWQDEIDETME